MDLQVILALIAAVTCIEFVDAADASAGKIFCSLPPAKQGENATLTCIFKNILKLNSEMTVNARGVKFADSETVSVLALKFHNTSDGPNSRPIVDDHFEFGNVSSSDDDNWNVSVIFPKSNQDYQGDYDCQLVGPITPSPATCPFTLDTLAEQGLNSTSVSPPVEQQNVSDGGGPLIDSKSQGSEKNTTVPELSNGELKAEEIAGIVIGVLIIAAVLVASLIIYLCRRSKKLKKETETHDPLDNGKNNGNVAPTTSSEGMPLMEDMKQELQEERGKCHKLEAEMKLKDAKIRCFEQEKEVADEELQALRRKVDDLTQDINRLKKEKQDADEELQALTQDINRLEKEMQVTEQKLNESQHGLQADMIEIKTLEEQKQKVNEELQSLRERFGKLTMEMRDKENRITSLEQELQETKKELQDMNIKCDKLQEQLNREQRKCQKLQKDAQKLPALKQTCERLARENEEKDTQIQYLEEKQQEREKELQREKEKCFKLASDLQCAEKIKYVEIKHEQEEANRKCRELQHKIEVNNLEIDRLKKEKEEQDRKLAEANRNVMKLTASEATLLERSTQLTHLLKQVEHTRHTQQHTGFGDEEVDDKELHLSVV